MVRFLQQLTPKWEKLAAAFAGDSSKVVIGKVDATEDEDLASRWVAVLCALLSWCPAASVVGNLPSPGG
jgi:hypothetical protein